MTALDVMRHTAAASNDAYRVALNTRAAAVEAVERLAAVDRISVGGKP